MAGSFPLSGLVVVELGTSIAAPTAAQIFAELGAEVIFGPTPHYDDAEVYAKALAERERCPFLSPYDDLATVAGNGSSLGYDA